MPTFAIGLMALVLISAWCLALTCRNTASALQGRLHYFSHLFVDIVSVSRRVRHVLRGDLSVRNYEHNLRRLHTVHSSLVIIENQMMRHNSEGVIDSSWMLPVLGGYSSVFPRYDPRHLDPEEELTHDFLRYRPFDMPAYLYRVSEDRRLPGPCSPNTWSHAHPP